MSLSERLASGRPNLAPKFETWIAGLPEADRAALIDAAKDPAWTNIGLRRMIEAEGHNVGKEAFGKWRARVAG